MSKRFIIITIVYLSCFNLSFSQIDSLKLDIQFDTIVKKDSIVKKSLNYSIDIFSFLRSTSFRKEKKTINPGNELAKLDSFDYGLYIRPDINYEKKKISINLKPRYNLEYDQYNNNYILDDFYFQELKLKYNLSNKSTVYFGRYFKNIGTSATINPSNLFFSESISLNPKLELKPMDFFELKYSLSLKWKLQLMANIGKGESEIYEIPFFEYHRKYALQIENYAESSQFSLLFAFDENKSYDFGFNGQKNMNEAILIWVDGAFNYKPNRFYPVQGNSTGLINYEMINDNKKLFFSNIAGASYTFNFGPTFSLEYFYNGRGYDRLNSKIYYDMILTSSNYNFDVTKELAKKNLARAINPGMQYIRKNYLFSQFGQNDFLNQVNYFFRYAYCFDDNTSQLSSLIEWNVINDLEIHSVVLYNFGKQNNGLNKFIRNQIMLGIIYKL